MSRGLLFTGYVGQLSLLTDDAVEQCLQHHPEYLNSKSRTSCEPQKMVFEATSEASIANCLSTIALGFAPIGLTAIADDALRISRMAKVEARMGIVVDDAGRATKQVEEEIVVTATRNRPGSTTRIERFLERTRQFSYDRHFNRYSNEYKRSHPEAAHADVAGFARKAAEAKRARMEDLHRKCTAMKSPEAAKAAKIFTQYSLGLGIGNTLVSYTSATWDKVKDKRWAMGLGYELTKSIIISYLNSRIQSSGTSSFPKKVTNTIKASFLGNVADAVATHGIFSTKEDAQASLNQLAQSPNFETDVNELLDYLHNRSALHTFVDGMGDMSNNIMRAISGKEELKDLTAEEIAGLDQNALNDPEVRDRILDVIDDKLYSQEDKLIATGNMGIDRLTFGSGYDLANVPVQTAIGIGTFYAVCMNTDSPMKALAAFGAIQVARGNVFGYLYYRSRDELVGQ
jgi:hypothetical protein